MPPNQSAVAVGGFEDEVEVVVHPAVGVADEVEAADGWGEVGEEPLPVFVVGEDALAVIASGGDVVEGFGEFDAQGASHIPSYPQEVLTSFPWPKQTDYAISTMLSFPPAITRFFRFNPKRSEVIRVQSKHLTFQQI